MTTILKLIAYGLGAVTLLFGSFFAFAALSGTPMHDVKGVGGMFPEDVESSTTESRELPDVEEEIDSDPRSVDQVFDAATSPLTAFALQDPFSAEELAALEAQLRLRLEELDRRERRLDEREAQLDRDEEHLAARYEDLVRLRTTILDQEEERRATSEELGRDRAALDEREAATYRAMASLFEEQDPEESAQLLTDIYGPDDAAKILIHLDDERVRALVAEIHKADPARGRSYVMALQELQPTAPDETR